MATIFADALSVDPGDFRRATEVTYLGTVWGTMVALRRMKARGAGTIVQLGSALAYRSIPLQAPYCGAKAIWGTRVMPGVLDWWLGRTAVDGQHTDEALPHDRQDNLWRPVREDRGAHGRFDSSAVSRSLHYWLTTHRGMVLGTAVALAMLGGSLAWWLGA